MNTKNRGKQQELKTDNVRDALKKPLILVIDGDPARLFVTSIVLQRLDYHVATVNSAEDALMVLSLVRPGTVYSLRREGPLVKR